MICTTVFWGSASRHPGWADTPTSACSRLFAAGIVQAARTGVRHEDREDCALGFVADLWPKLDTISAPLPTFAQTDQTSGVCTPAAGRGFVQPAYSEAAPPVGDAWLAVVAGQWARTVRRQELRLRWRERSLESVPATVSARGQQALTDRSCPPYAAAIAREIRERVLDACCALTDQQRSLFVRRVLEQHSIAVLARDLGRSEGAIRQSLLTVRRRLRRLLAGKGFGEADAREYLYELARATSIPALPVSTRAPTS